RYATGVPLPGIWRVEPARDTDVTAQLTALVTPMLAGAAAPGSIAAALPDVPLVELAAPAPGHLGAIIYSGDGGWRDLDKPVRERASRPAGGPAARPESPPVLLRRRGDGQRVPRPGCRARGGHPHRRRAPLRRQLCRPRRSHPRRRGAAHAARGGARRTPDVT